MGLKRSEIINNDSKYNYILINSVPILRSEKNNNYLLKKTTHFSMKKWPSPYFSCFLSIIPFFEQFSTKIALIFEISINYCAILLSPIFPPISSRNMSFFHFNPDLKTTFENLKMPLANNYR